MKNKVGKYSQLSKRLRESSTALAIGASLLLPSVEATAAKPKVVPSKPTVRERIVTVREKLGQSVGRQQVDPDSNTPQSEPKLLSQWPNSWNNWRNW